MTSIGFRALMIALTFTAIFTASSFAQPQTPPWALSPDSARHYRVGPHLDTIAPAKFSQSYSYGMVYDSICHVEYLFTEASLNGQLLQLLHWKDGRLVHAEQGYLTFNSRTANFPVSAGDTVSFYRELKWYHPITKWQDTSSYYAEDTLEYIVHLVRASDYMPLAQLDSTGILARVTPGAPHIYGSRPLMALVRYVVPGPVAGDSAFIGVTVRANGAGKYHFVRFDGYTHGVSNRLNRADYQRYLQVYSGAYNKRSPSDLATAGDDRFALSVRTAERDADITFSAPPDETGRMEVMIYDIGGSLVFSPYSSASAGGATTIHHRFTEPGTYIVGLLHRDRLVRTTKVIIDR